MKTIWTLTLAAAALSAGAPALAQDGSGAKPEAKPEAKKTEPRRERRRRTRRNPWSPVNYLKDRLKLREDQIEKLEAFYAERAKSRREAWEKMRKEGTNRRWDPQAWQKAMAEARKAEDAKMKTILDETQMKKYVEIRKQQEEQSKRWRERSRNRGNRGNRGWGRRSSLKDRALEALKLDKETKEVLAPIVEQVVKKLNGAREARSKFQRTSRDVKDDEQLRTAIAAYRKERDAARDALKKARAELTELLTPTQEAALIRLGVLD